MSHTYASELPSISIVVEWENAKLSELERANLMLRAVSKQVTDLAERFERPPELILIYDPDVINPAFIKDAIAKAISQDSNLFVRLAPMSGLNYYEQKNYGATLATGSLLVFLDSDIVPADDWLLTLLETAASHPGCVVGGATYMDDTSFLGRAFALFWFFPLKTTSSRTIPVATFFANSVIFPKVIFDEYFFQPSTTSRGQCLVLADRLANAGISILRAEAARATHPAPNGVSHFFRRALCDGYDAQVLDSLREGQSRFANPVVSGLARAYGNYKRTWTRVTQNRHGVSMPLREVPLALTVGFSYYTVYAAGELVSLATPWLIPKYLGI